MKPAFNSSCPVLSYIRLTTRLAHRLVLMVMSLRSLGRQRDACRAHPAPVLLPLLLSFSEQHNWGGMGASLAP